MAQAPRNPTRPVQIGSLTIGAGNPIAVQSMCATKTADVDATVAQIEHLVQAGADIIRVAVDTKADAQALVEIRQRTRANLSCDLQENYRLAADIAPGGRQDPLQPGPLVPSRADQAVAGQGEVPRRRGRRRTTAPSAWV